MVTWVRLLFTQRGGGRRRLRMVRPDAVCRRGPPIAILVAALFAAIAPQVAGSGGPERRVPQATVTPRSSRALYRIVGCRSHGAGAVRSGPAGRAVAIGFDDGPAADTPAFLTMLERSRARATFFMVGRQLSDAFGPMLLRALRDGDVLGDHSWSHPDLRSSRDVRGQLASTLGAIRSLSGYTPCVFRPPYGAYDQTVLQQARSLGLATVLWNVDPSDYTQPGTAAIVGRVLAQVRPGSIIISHDGGGPRAQTLAAYPSIIASLRGRGYRIETIPELLGLRPVYVPCVRLCAGIGVPRGAVPRNAIIERAPWHPPQAAASAASNDAAQKSETWGRPRVWRRLPTSPLLT